MVCVRTVSIVIFNLDFVECNVESSFGDVLVCWGVRVSFKSVLFFL